MSFEYKEELDYLDRDGVWYPVTVLHDDGGYKVKVESDLTCHVYWADREKLRKRQAAQPLRAVDAAMPPSAETLSGSNIVPAVEFYTQPRP